MEVKPGYKQSEVGVIPKDWDQACLKEISSQITDGDHVTPNRAREGYYLLSARNVRDGFLDLSDVDFVGESEFKRMRNRCAPQAGDLLISCSGHGLGRVAIVPNGLNCVLVRSAALVKIDKTKGDSGFVQYWLQGANARKQISDSLSRAAQPNLFLNSIERLRSPLPPQIEQRAIATALSDADALLGGLDRLIAKKRDLKQAAMQQLLTGQTRLPSFVGEWGVVELKSIYERVFKKSPLSSGDGLTQGAFPLFVSGGEPKRTEIALFQGTEALIVSDGGVFDVKYFSGDFSVTDHCFVFSLKGDMQFYFQWMSLRKAELDLMTFKGSGLRNLDKPSFGKVEVPVPEHAEQAAIAEALSAMDTELAALEQRREKTRALKQAMMQELLTGRTRLISAEEFHA